MVCTNDLVFTAIFENTLTLKFKAAFTNAFFAAVDHNYDHKQLTLKHKHTKWIEIH